MQITIYSTTTCSFCHALTAWLDKENVPYTKKITDTDQAALTEFMNVNDGNFGVPFTVITDDTGKQNKILGYDRQAFKEVLNI